MSYDPDPKRRKKRKGKEPPQLKRWRLAKKRSYDPKKIFARGSRGGTYFRPSWFTGKKRYDPERFATARSYGRKARHYGSKVESGISRYGGIIGFLAALAAGVYGSYSNMEKVLKDYPMYDENGKAISAGNRWLNLASKEYTHLYTTEEGSPWTPTSYLKYKFLGTDPATGKQTGSAWVVPFWASLIGFLASYLIPSKILPARIKTPLRKISGGALAMSTIGALVLPATSPEEIRGTSRPNNTGNPATSSRSASFYQ